ncbi:SET domain-containing protein [Mollisia scopiformis]|uniref:SET domain-containing protein n=1 Tax=Mollisia scopiformis TaxID=149040 RepID=A0A194XGI3_MOLSC|nr:SET domain-containing protein [Mollisia scopiformis]KUJ19305.1 SET domain-containing protein [Mollisia scopiformis]
MRALPCHSLGCRVVYESLEISPEKDRGLGLKTSSDISAGTAIGEYKGKPTTQHEWEKLDKSERRYMIRIGASFFKERRYLNGEVNGNKLARVNHSCEPNCQMEEWIADGYARLVLIAKRNITVGEYLSFHYGNETNFNGGCRCGTECQLGTSLKSTNSYRTRLPSHAIARGPAELG